MKIKISFILLIISCNSLHGADVQANLALLRATRACIGCNLVGANLAGLNLQWAKLTGANLSNVHAPGASFNNADFSGANFSGAQLTAADFTNIKTSSQTIFTGADLTDTVLKKREIQKPSTFIGLDSD